MRSLPTAPSSRRPKWASRTVRTSVLFAAAAVVLVGAACSGTPKQTGTSAGTSTPAPQAAGAAKKAADALKTDLKPLNAAVPLPLRKLDGLAVSMSPVQPALKGLTVATDVRDVPITIGAVALPSFGVSMSVGGPSLGSILAGLGAPPVAIPTMPTTIPTAPPGVAPGATPPPGFATPPAGMATPPAGFPTPPPGFGPPGGIPTLPPGFTIPGMP